MPSLLGIALPVSETYIKSEFTLRYNIHALKEEEASGAMYSKATWRNLEPGAYFSDMQLQLSHLPAINGLTLVEVSVFGTESLEEPDGTNSLMSRTHIPFDQNEERFLVGIDPGGKIHYLSGDIFLDPMDGFLSNPGNLMDIVKVRLAFLSPGEINPLKAKKGHSRFWTYSAFLKANVMIDLIDQNSFMIAYKSEPEIPVYTYGDWKKN